MTPTIAESSPTKTCPFCAELIKAEARKCRYCGEMLDTPTGGTSINAGDTSSSREQLSKKINISFWVEAIAPLKPNETPSGWDPATIGSIALDNNIVTIEGVAKQKHLNTALDVAARVPIFGLLGSAAVLGAVFLAKKATQEKRSVRITLNSISGITAGKTFNDLTVYHLSQIHIDKPMEVHIFRANSKDDDSQLKQLLSCLVDAHRFYVATK